MARWTPNIISDAEEEETRHSTRPHRNGRLIIQKASRGGVGWLWVLTLGSLISVSVFWIYMSPPPAHQHSRSQSLTGLAAGFDLGGESSSGGRDHSSAEESALSAKEPSSTKEEKSSTTDSLLWWIESAPLPSLSALKMCLTLPNASPPTLIKERDGFTIIRQGREHPQTLYERGEQIWLKTPTLKSIHAQTYDHLSLAACLKSPGATLHDPLLVRMWTYTRWPQKSRSGGVDFDDLFLIQSQRDVHTTRGLSRLGLDELGLMSDHSTAREILKRVAVAWMTRPSQTDSSDTHTEQVFRVKGVELKVQPAASTSTWLGAEDVRVLLNQNGERFSAEDLKEVERALLSTTTQKSYPKNTKQGERKSRERKSRERKSRERKNRKKMRRKTDKSKKRDQGNKRRGQGESKKNLPASTPKTPIKLKYK